MKMSTTVQVKRRTIRLLEKVKAELKVKSYDEAIVRLVKEKFGFADDMFGVDKGKISSFSERDRMEDRD